MTGLLAAPQVTCTYWLDPWLLLEEAPLWPEGQHTAARTELCRAGRVLVLPGCPETTTPGPEWEQHPVPVHLTGDIQVVHEALDVEGKVGGVGAHQLLELLTLLIQSQQGSGVLFYIQLVLCPKLFREVIYQSLIKIPATYERVKGSGQDLAEAKEDQKLLDKVCAVSFTQHSKKCHHCLPHSFRGHLATTDRPTKALSL